MTNQNRRQLVLFNKLFSTFLIFLLVSGRKISIKRGLGCKSVTWQSNAIKKTVPTPCSSWSSAICQKDAFSGLHDWLYKHNKRHKSKSHKDAIMTQYSKSVYSASPRQVKEPKWIKLKYFCMVANRSKKVCIWNRAFDVSQVVTNKSIVTSYNTIRTIATFT